MNKVIKEQTSKNKKDEESLSDSNLDAENGVGRDKEECDCEECACGNKEDQPKEDEYKEKYIRALADYQNLSRRIEREREDIYQFVSIHLLTKILPILDDLERAQEKAEDKAFSLIYNKLWQVLKEEGMERMELSEDDEFDPEKMECIDAAEGGKKLITIRTGYIMKGKVIRPAQVKVVK